MHSNQMTFLYCYIKYRFKVKWSSQSFNIFLKSNFFCNYGCLHMVFFLVFTFQELKKNWHSFLKLFFNSLCLFLICGVPGPCSNDFFHTALIIKFIHFPSCTIPLNKKVMGNNTSYAQSTEEKRAYQELSVERNHTDCTGRGLRWKSVYKFSGIQAS